MLKIGILGCSGRMGACVIKEASKQNDVLVTCGCSESNNEHLGFPVFNNIKEFFSNSDNIRSRK